MVGRLYPDSKRGQSAGEPGGEPKPPYACIVSLDRRSPYIKYGSTDLEFNKLPHTDGPPRARIVTESSLLSVHENTRGMP